MTADDLPLDELSRLDAERTPGEWPYDVLKHKAARDAFDIAMSIHGTALIAAARERDELRKELTKQQRIASDLFDEARSAQKQRDELAEHAQSPLRSDHPAIVNAEKSGYDRGWDAGIAEIRSSSLRAELDAAKAELEARRVETAAQVSAAQARADAAGTKLAEVTELLDDYCTAGCCQFADENEKRFHDRLRALLAQPDNNEGETNE